MRGMSVEGSVDIEASSKNTTGRSIPDKVKELDRIQVVQIYVRRVSRIKGTTSKPDTYHISSLQYLTGYPIP